MYLRLDRRPKGGGRGAAIITVDFDGGIIDDEVDGIVVNDVALQSSFQNLDFQCRFGPR